MIAKPAFDPKLDLVLERFVDVPRHLVWEAWTKPEHLKVWFCPKPWGVSDCEIDLRPGGIFKTTMLSPEGNEFPNIGCYLEVVPMERLVFTSVLHPGYRPAPAGDLPFTAIITMESEGTGTRYFATALHQDESGCEKHKAMGFHQGWGTALDQLVAHVKTIQQTSPQLGTNQWPINPTHSTHGHLTERSCCHVSSTNHVQECSKHGRNPNI